MKRALVVDDSKTMRDMVSHVLKQAGFDPMCAVDGADALKVLGDQDVVIITSDFNMPNMNGVQLVQTLRQNPKYKFTPILLISTEQDVQIKEQAKQAGASGWVKKPFDPETLAAAIKKICGL